MFIQIHDVLQMEQVKTFRDLIAAAPDLFEDGGKTAGWHAKPVKHNEQAKSAAAAAITSPVGKLLLAHPVFKAAAMPKQFVRLMVSRYRHGMEYGTHVDDALMGGIRTDLSFTLFLSEPTSYDGGALMIEANDGDTEVKLEPGSLILYPTTTLHRVEPVTRGERLAIVGWVRSFIRSHEDREILFDLENTIAALHGAKADRAIMDRLFKVKANLTRKWAED